MDSIKECGMMAPASSVPSLNTTIGVGNVTPPQIAASTAAEQSGMENVGSGDLFGGFPKEKKKKYGVYRKNGNKLISQLKDMSYDDAVSKAKSLNERNNTDEYKIYQMA